MGTSQQNGNGNGFKYVVDKTVFNPTSRKFLVATKPILVCVAEVRADSNLDAFCSLCTQGTKLLVGDGPYLDSLKSRYSDVHFVGNKSGTSLAHYYANADVVVLPNFFTINNYFINVTLL